LVDAGPGSADRVGHRDRHQDGGQEQHATVQPLTGVAADHERSEQADHDADRDTAQQHVATVLAGQRRCIGAAYPGHPGVHAGVYLLLDPLEEGRHHRVAVLGAQLLVSRRRGPDPGDDLTPGSGVRLARTRHPLARRGLDLVV